MYTLVHTVESSAALRARLTNIGARCTDAAVQVEIGQHGVCRRATQLGAPDHESKVPRLDVTPARFETVIHRIAPADLVALQTITDALLHGLAQ